MDPLVVCILQALLLMIFSPRGAAAPCPRPCSCPQPTELHCTFRSLLTIPSSVPKHVERMNLGFNSINRITEKSLAGLRKLELFMVHGNDIHSLPDGAFRDLTSLQMLKISYNKLTEINRHTLQGLWSLARLHLDHNRLEFIHPDAFQGLTSLRLLQLEGNRLQQLHPATFTTFTLMHHFHVSTLKHLYLSDNGLTALPSRLLAAMPQLENLFLHGNPWTCDCNMRWLQEWNNTSPGVLKCKKDRNLPSGQLCPVCSSPRHLHRKELNAVENLVCTRPSISSPDRTDLPEDVESEVLTMEDFKQPFGNVSLGLSDEHGNGVDLECSISEPKELASISWEQVDRLHLTSNISLSVDLECPVDREKYEQLWRLIAYYSSVPAHLQRGIILSKDPHPTYVYRQDSEKDALYYTGVKMNMMAQPEWMMQPSIDLQLNRPQSSAKMVKLTLSSEFSEKVELELMQRQRRTWVIIESTNTTSEVSTAILGSPSQMNCNVHSSGQAVIQWRLPDGSKLEAPYNHPDNRVSVSNDGKLVIKAVSHTDAGIYYCISRLHRDFAVLPFYLTVQESSSPAPGEDTSVTPIEGFAGNSISISCVTSGSPDAEINWILPSSDIMTLKANSSRASVYPNGTLHIPQTQLSDSGYYKCIAINQHGVDTLATKVSVVRHKGLIRPLRKFPARPQSAAGVNTQIKVPIEDTAEASGEGEVTQEGMIRQEPFRRKIPGGVAPGRKGAHPSRSMWRRPQVLRRPTGSQAADRKSTVENRRRVNVSKSKIDPEKWADILAKIRDRNGQSTVTSLPQRKVTGPTTPLEITTEGLSHNVRVEENLDQDYFPTARSPEQQTKTNKHSVQSQSTHVTSNSYTTHKTYDMTSNRQHAHSTQAITEPLVTQTASSVQHTSHMTNLDQLTSSNSKFFLPQTTSFPLQAVTFWQDSTNTPSSSSVFYQQENHITNTDVDGAETAGRSREEEESDKKLSLIVPISSNNDRTPFEVNTNDFTISQEHTQFQMQPTSLDVLKTETMITTASPTTTHGPARKTESEEHSPPRVRQPNSRRKNSGRRRGSGKRKLKQNKPKAENAPTASPQPNIEPLEVTTATLSTTVPFTSGQVASSDRLSHKESTLSWYDHEAAPKPSSPPKTKDSYQPLAKPLFESTSVAPPFPTASPGESHGKMNSEKALGISESVSPPVRSATLQMFTSSPLRPGKPSEETHRASVAELGLLPNPGGYFEDFHIKMQVQTDVKRNLSGHRYTTAQNDGKMLLKDTGMDFTLLPSSFTSAASFNEREIGTTSGYTSSGIVTKPNSRSEDHLNSEPGSSKTLTEPENSADDQYQTLSNDLDVDWNMKGNVDATTASTMTIISAASTMPDLAVSNVTPPTDVKVFPPVKQPRITVSQNPDQLINPIITTSEDKKTAGFFPATLEPDHNSPSTVPIKTTSVQIVTTTPKITTLQTNPSRETMDVSARYQLPGRGSTLRGKPRIMENTFQTFTVKAETDAVLPCEAEGQPMPFLSWTKVSTGASIAQNTKVQRFEVHPNGTLIIRSTQLTDKGQYLCTVQNQYGTDKMLINVVVLSQHPRVLQPRHRDVTVPLGGNVDLECKVEGHPMPKVTWVLPSQVHITAAPHGVQSHAVHPQQHVVVMTDGTLRISQASYTDRGIYKCIGSSAAGADSVSVRVFVSVLPPVILQSQHENVSQPEGSSAFIHCSATGAPLPVIRWITPDNVQLTPSQLVTRQNLFVFPNGTLHIRDLGPSNAGRYECSASNAVTSSRRTVILSVRRNPFSAKASITSSSPSKTDVIYGTKVLLNCVAKGEPRPRIIWRTPSKKLVDSQYSYDPRIKVFSNGSLTIHSVTDKDSGDYLCVARNKMGDDYILLQVNVLTRAAKIEQKPQRFRQEVVYGGDLKVDCVASGLPNPEISWALPDGTMVNPVKQTDGVSVGRSRRYVVFDNGTLYFNDVGMPEEGDYTCYAENQVGKDEMKVSVKVKMGSSPPQIRNKDQKSVRVFYGETVTLRCNAKGEPAPVITWISPTNRVISPALDKYQILDDGTLVVQKAQRFDGGNYTCMVRNSAGQDYKVTRLEVLVTPPVINGLGGTTNAIKVTAVQDQQKLVDCVAKGTPTPRIMWVLPGNVILPAPYYSNRMAVHLNGTLEIRSPKKTDSGQLACIARNEGGEVKLVVDLDVKEAIERPQIRGPKTDSQSLTVGNAMTLNCSFQGSPLSHVTWILPNGTPLLRGARFSKFFHQSDGSLVISNPSVAEVGMYRCLGHNSRGLVEQTITLSPGRKPEINNRYNSPISVMNGESLLLHCQTTGEPLRLAWTLPSGVVLNRPQRAGRYAILPNGTLAIQQVSVYDRGPYVCRAANEYGSSLLSVSVIVIAYPPRITSNLPSVTYAKRGVAVQLNCVATGIPKVELAWETPDKMRLAVNSQPRLFGNKYLHPQGSLIVQNPTQRDAGVYRCTARNALGVDTKATFLNVF